MSYIDVLDLSISFSGRELFKNLNFQVNPGDRIGLIGPNGSGKTSLLRLLTNEISPDKGSIRIAGATKLGYLPQDIYEELSGEIFQWVLDSIPGRVSLTREIQRIEKLLKEAHDSDEQEQLAARIAETHSDLSHLDIEFPAHKAEKILEGLGFGQEEFQNSLSSLSGGWKMRVMLGSLLYQNPEVLLLDEPTNHLDIPSVRWLEQFLGDFKGAMILVCHDRDFLNRQINRVISFEPEGLRNFKGNYDQYQEFREEESKTLEANARNQEIKVKEAKKFIERFRYKATKARQAQSKIKLLKKMELVQSHKRHKNIRFKFPEVPRSGRVVLNISGVSKRFGEKILYEDLELTLMRGEKIAIIGPNGSGKTTLLRMIAGEISPDKGTVTMGHDVTMSYYAQHHSDMLIPDNTIIEEVYNVVPNETVSFVRGVCGAFLFSGDDVDKPIKVLSGGEKARVCLAEMLIKPGNLLVMDEPSNHLDLVSSEVLIDALEDYNGSLLFVSHNQSFINRLATKIWDVRNGEIYEYPGSLYEYYDHLSMDEEQPGEEAVLEVSKVKIPENGLASKTKQSKKLLRKEKAKQRNMINSRLRPLKEELSRLEEGIASLENREHELGNILKDPDLFKDKEKSIPLLNEYGQVKKKLEEMLSRWEGCQQRLEEVLKELDL